MNETDLINARAAVDYARKIIQYSSSSLDTQGEAILQLAAIVIASRYHCYSDQESLQDLFRAVDFHDTTHNYHIKHTVKTTKKMRAGNCHEYASLVLNKLRKLGTYQAENIVILNGSHSLVVVNRLPESDINNPATWGPDAFLIDAWAMLKEDENLPDELKYRNAIFSSQEVHEKLKGFSGTVDYNSVYPYDPTEHTLVVSRSIAKNDQSINQKMIQSTIRKLNLIKSTAAVLLPRNAIFSDFFERATRAVNELIRMKDDLIEQKKFNTELDRHLTKTIHQFLKEAQQLAKQNNVAEEFEKELVIVLTYNLPWPIIHHALKNYSNKILAHILAFTDEETFHYILYNCIFFQQDDENFDLLDFAVEYRDLAYVQLLASKFNDQTLVYLLTDYNSKSDSKINMFVQQAPKLALKIFDVAFFQRIHINQPSSALNFILKALGSSAISDALSKVSKPELNQLMQAHQHRLLRALVENWDTICLHRIILRFNIENLTELCNLIISEIGLGRRFVAFYLTAKEYAAKLPVLRYNYGILFRKINLKMENEMPETITIANDFGQSPPQGYYDNFRQAIETTLAKYSQLPFRLFGYSPMGLKIIEALKAMLALIEHNEKIALYLSPQEIIDRTLQDNKFEELKEHQGFQTFFQEKLTERLPLLGQSQYMKI